MSVDFQDLVARLETLERHKLTVDDLPLGPLQRKLEQRWQPEGSVLLQSSSVTRAALAQKLDWGTGTLTLTASNFTDKVTITHALEVAPAGVVLAAAGGELGSWGAGFSVGNLAAGSFTVTAEVATPRTGSIPFHWIAFA